MKRIRIIITYFGVWPEWIDLFLESCRLNPSIDWLVFTDCGLPRNRPDNVCFEEIDFATYCARAGDRLGVRLRPSSSYKLCDLKPALGALHVDRLEGYAYWGYGDVDVVYGRLRQFYDDRVLRHNVISTHARRLSGHLCLLRNDERFRNAFRRIPNWRTHLETPDSVSMDERLMTKVVLRHRRHPAVLRRLYGVLDPHQRGHYFKEQHSTVLSRRPWWDGAKEHPVRWFWRDGRLTNARDGEREFMYLHFMNLRSSRWLDTGVLPRAPWEGREKIVHLDYRAAPHGWEINEGGFFARSEDGPAGRDTVSVAGATRPWR